ncbi:MAG: hypothetical protein GXY32_04715 [Ruminococcaceae bacterium]|nr:hypothetical protein [Oscillospiraceae bacterium]
MKACDICHAQVTGTHEFCPLCGKRLQPAEPYGYTLPGNRYPDLSRISAQYNFMLRLLLFLSLLGGGVSVLVNVLVPTGFWWCLIVIVAEVYLWLTIPPLLRRARNYAKRLLFQTLLTALLMVALDFIIGWRGWSVSYAIPSLLCAGIVAIAAMIVFSRTNWPQYVFYQFTMGLLGFIPLVLYFFGLSTSIVMVLITAALGLGSVLVTVVFGDRSLKSDFRRRFHF